MSTVTSIPASGKKTRERRTPKTTPRRILTAKTCKRIVGVPSIPGTGKMGRPICLIMDFYRLNRIILMKFQSKVKVSLRDGRCLLLPQLTSSKAGVCCNICLCQDTNIHAPTEVRCSDRWKIESGRGVFLRT